MKKFSSVHIAFLIVISLAVVLFASFTAGVVMAVLTLILNSIVVQSRIKFLGIDLLYFLYFLGASLVYWNIGNGDYSKDYTGIVLLPFIYYLTASGVPNNENLLLVKTLFAILIFFSIAMFFRDIDGNFTLSITKNIYMSRRTLDTTSATEAGRFFKNATLVAIWLVTTFIFSLCLYNCTKNTLYLLGALFALILVFLSNTRTAMGCAAVILFVNFFFFGKKGTLIAIILILLPILLIIVSSVGSLYSSQMQRFSDLLNSSSNYGLGHREIYWGYTLLLIAKSIWGYGHTYVYDHLGFSSHNEYLGQLVSIGVIPAIIYFIFIINYFVKLFKSVKQTGLSDTIWNQIGFYMAITYLINGMTEQISLSNRFWISLFFIVLGFGKYKFSYRKK